MITDTVQTSTFQAPPMRTGHLRYFISLRIGYCDTMPAFFPPRSELPTIASHLHEAIAGEQLLKDRIVAVGPWRFTVNTTCLETTPGNSPGVNVLLDAVLDGHAILRHGDTIKSKNGELKLS